MPILSGAGCLMDRNSLIPSVLIADSDPDHAMGLNDIVTDVLGISAATFTDSRLALAWCAGHPIHTDLVITRENMQPLNGFKMLKEMDAIFFRPVYAILLICPGTNEADAQAWFYQLDKVFSMIKPLKALCPPYFKYEIGTALNRAFPWYDSKLLATRQEKNEPGKSR